MDHQSHLSALEARSMAPPKLPCPRKSGRCLLGHRSVGGTQPKGFGDAGVAIPVGLLGPGGRSRPAPEPSWRYLHLPCLLPVSRSLTSVTPGCRPRTAPAAGCRGCGRGYLVKDRRENQGRVWDTTPQDADADCPLAPLPFDAVALRLAPMLAIPRYLWGSGGSAKIPILFTLLGPTRATS